MREQVKTVRTTIGQAGIEQVFLGSDIDPYNQLLVAALGKGSFWRMDDGMYSYSYEEKRRKPLHRIFHQLKASCMKRMLGIDARLPINTAANGESPAGRGDFLYLPELLSRPSPKVVEITAAQIREAMAFLQAQNVHEPICPTGAEEFAIYLSQGLLQVEEVSVLTKLQQKLGVKRLIYKPHPNDSADKLDYIGQHMPGILLCGSKIPVEIILYFEPNITTVIGYQSTTLVLAKKFTGRDIECISIAKLYTKQTIHPVYVDMMKKMQVQFIE